MAKWLNDVCFCLSEFSIDNGVTTGELITPCSYHTTFEDSLNDNRLKNLAVNLIRDIVEITPEKEIVHSFDFETGAITLTLIGFNESEIELIYSLNLNLNIEIG